MKEIIMALITGFFAGLSISFLLRKIRQINKERAKNKRTKRHHELLLWAKKPREYDLTTRYTDLFFCDSLFEKQK